MLHKIEVTDDVTIVFSHEEPGYADVLETFGEATFVDVATYNLSADDEHMIQRLRDLGTDVQVRLVTNLPNRFDTYFGSAPKRKFRTLFATYRSLLDPGKFISKGSSFFNIDNHSKIVLTDQLAYIGSANYSAESQGNYECGVLFSDPDIIASIREEIVDRLVEAAVPNDMTPVAEARVLVQSLRKRLTQLAASLAEGLFMRMNGSEPELDSFQREDATVSAELLEQIDGLVDDIENEIGEYCEHPLLNPVYELLTKYPLDRVREIVSVDEPFHRLATWNHDTEPDDKDWFPYDEDITGPDGETITVRHEPDNSDPFEELIDEILPHWGEFAGAVHSVEAMFDEMTAELTRLEKTGYDIDNT